MTRTYYRDVDYQEREYCDWSDSAGSGEASGSGSGSGDSGTSSSNWSDSYDETVDYPDFYSGAYYDSSDRVTTQIVSNAGGPVTVLTTDYGERLDDQPVSRSATVDGVPDFVNLYEYDDQDRLVALTQTGQDAADVADKLVTFDYDEAGRFVTITRYASLDGSQLVAVSDYTHDEYGRPAALVHHQDPVVPLAEYTWTWEGGGDTVEVVHADAASGTQFGAGWMLPFGGSVHTSRELEINPLPDYVWTFDAAFTGHLVQTVSPDGTADYQYDPRGQNAPRVKRWASCKWLRGGKHEVEGPGRRTSRSSCAPVDTTGSQPSDDLRGTGGKSVEGFS